MPTRRSAATSPSKSPAKADAQSKRKGGAPKRVEASPPPPEETEDQEMEAAEEPAPVRRTRGRPKKAAAVVEEVSIHEIETGEPITINMEDLIDMPEASIPAPTKSAKKRKAPAKSPASKKNKAAEGSPSKVDLGAAGDNENLIQCTLCDASVVQLVRHIRAQHGDDPDYDTKIKEARALEAKVQSSASPRKGANNLLDDINTTVAKMEKVVPTTRFPRESSGSLIRPKNTQCPICEKVVRRYDLNKHIRNVHSGEKPNKCPYCDYASPWKGNLNTHIAGVHTKARLHDCVRCGLSFKTRSAMIGHVRKVHDKMYQPKERLFECEECNKKFYKKFHLQRHIRVHTGEKPFVCAFCEKCFASKTNMDSHIQSVHLKIKPFKCGYCDKGFARKKMMLVHIRKYHMNKDDTELAISLNDVDDITLDDNLDDNQSDTGSLESGEILTTGDDQGMVLVKMKDDEADGTSGEVKSYMFVSTNELPSDLDTTAEQSMLESHDTSVAKAPAKTSEPEAASTSAAAATSTAAIAETVEASEAPTTQSPMVISVAGGQVVQAVQTSEGIMLLTSDPKTTSAEQVSEPVTQVITATVRDTEETTAPTTESADVNEAEQEAETADKAADVPAPEEPETTEEPDLVQQALAETLPEVSASAVEESEEQLKQSEPVDAPAAVVSKELVTNDTGDLTTRLPDNLLASEEAEQPETANGGVADFEFLTS